MRSGADACGGAYHWREYGMTELLPCPAHPQRILLLGCGDAGERPLVERAGYRPFALDIRRSPGVDCLADAHRIPLRDASVDVVLSMQVLEHLEAPWLAVAEVARVLRPGGWFVGSVAFLKAYHHSYFHMTHRGVTSLLRSVGLEVDRVAGAQSLTYSLYGSLLPVGSRRVRRLVLGSLDRAIAGMRSRLWSLRTGLDAGEPTARFGEDPPLSFRLFDRLRFAPAIVFRARKDGRAPAPARAGEGR